MPKKIDWEAVYEKETGLEAADSCGFEMVSLYHEDYVAWLESNLSKLLAKTGKTIQLGFRYGGIDGGHHKQWVIDQMLRKLAGKDYKRLVKEHKAGEDGPNTYGWDEGVAP